MMQKALITNTLLLDSEAAIKRSRDRDYLMELKTENLLFSHYSEAGLNGLLNYAVKAHGGWDSPTSQVRGMFMGHWLSAAARIINETEDTQLKAKADFIVSEIARCQDRNGNGWAFPIPEKYLFSVKAGKNFWAPQYVCHKNMMGLLDMFIFTDNQQALEIVKGCADWFYDFSNNITRENMDHMMEIEETGGIMELWADLYAVTKDPKHLELMRRYERPRLYAPLLKGEDILTNMHANTTIPEIHGCARAYEVTGEKRYRQIVEQYWDLAVTQRGTFATGGQTSGEVWTPLKRQMNRLGESNQEHCVVYNMIRLADYLYRWTGKVEYADYIEMNIQNGLFAQGFWQSRGRDTLCEDSVPETGIVSYYLPLGTNSQKRWGSKTEDFWCCHGTAVQANAKYREYIYYQAENHITVAQYLPSLLKTRVGKTKIEISQQFAYLNGTSLNTAGYIMQADQTPDFWAIGFSIKSDEKKRFTIKFRLPWWRKGDVDFYINGESVSYDVEDGFAILDWEWKDDKVSMFIPKGLNCIPLPDQTDTVAFLDGPVVLAGLVTEQRTLIGDIDHPETILQLQNEREWDTWLNNYQTINQPSNFYLKPLNQIGKEIYTVYFPVNKG